MALFKSKAKTEKVEKNNEKASRIVVPADKASVLIGPRITEKATNLTADKNIVVFNVSSKATKTSVRQAVQEMYKVTPLKIRISSVPRKGVVRRGQVGVKGGGKKAYVHLKKGDSINLF